MENLFIGCDWGTTSFRLALVRHDFSVETGTDVFLPLQAPAGEGVAGVFSAWQSSGTSDRAGFFLNHLEQYLEQTIWSVDVDHDLPVVISGMASSTIGMHELPYADVSFPFDGSGVVGEELYTKSGRTVWLMSGVRTKEDVARGEETQVLGVASRIGTAAVAGKVLVLPGTHSKHMRVDETGITDLRTVMTGELFSLLATQSVLRHSVRLPAPDAPSVRKSFLEALELGFDGELMQNLFRVRVDHLSGRGTDSDRTAWLLGLLLGAELSVFQATTDQVLLCSGERQLGWYEAAMQHLLPGRYAVLDGELSGKAAFYGQAVWFRRNSSLH